MSKTALRYLSLGFLLSAVILAGYRAFFYDPQNTAESTEAPSAEFSQEEKSYKEKYEQLLAETEVAKMENESSTESKSSETSETTESQPKDNESEEKTSSDIITTTIIINEGEPSSVAASQLQNQGIVEDAAEFNDYLEENNLTTLIRPGSFTVSSDMSYGEIADTLLSESN